MEKTMCGADCGNCFFSGKCSGCIRSSCAPFGKDCFVAHYIKIGGKEKYEEYKRKLIAEINELDILGMPKIDTLYPLVGGYVNLEYTLPNGEKVSFLDDREIYLGSQVFSLFECAKCFGIVASPSFILVCEYGENGESPELIAYKKR